MRFASFLIFTLLTGCTSLEVAVPEGNAQIRVWRFGGEADIGGISPAVRGEGAGAKEGCLVTSIGVMPHCVRVELGGCSVVTEECK